MLRKWWWLVVLVWCEVVSTGFIEVEVHDLSSRHHLIVTGW
jgi:hypothetical protein